MRKLLLLIMISVYCVAPMHRGLAAQKPKETISAPTPVTNPAEQERISRLMLDAQAAQLAVVNAQAEADKKMKAFNEGLALLQKEHHAEGCALTFDKQWECPKGSD